MARQKGIIPIEGTIDNLIFYKTRYGHLVRKKGEISPERYATDPAFARNREAAAEFGYASRAGKLLRTAFRQAASFAETGSTNFRLAAAIVRILKNDPVGARGERRLNGPYARELSGFEWNPDAPLNRLLAVPFTGSIDTVSGTLQVTLAPFRAADIPCPTGSTHVRISGAGVAADFEQGTYTVAPVQSVVLSREDPYAAGRVLPVYLTPAPSQTIWLLGLGVQWYQEVNGASYPLQSGNGFGLVGVEVQSTES